jgi:hypothetical protein
MELETEPEGKRKKVKTARALDPRHHEITSQIKGVWLARKSDSFLFPPRFPKALEKFLQHCDAAADEFLRIYDEALGASVLPFAKHSRSACDPTYLCTNWLLVVAELDNLAAANERDARKSKGGFKKTI